MAQAQRPAPRKSVFSANAHPLKAPTAGTEGASEPSKQEAATPKAKGGKSGSEATVATPKTKATFYADQATLERFREAFIRTQGDEGYGSFSDFIIQAALEKTQCLEKKYNEGKPYTGIKRLSAGRPLSH